MFEKLETERLYLTPIAINDIEKIESMHSDPRVMAYAGDGKPMSETENWRFCAQLMGHWHIRGYGMYSLYLKKNNSFCGLCGLHYPPMYPGPEIGWRLAYDCWSNGYAIEAANVVQDFAFNTLMLDKVYHFIEPDNKRSIRLAHKLGAQRIDQAYLPVIDESLQDYLIFVTENS